jgi:hypothetical protein
MLPMIILVACTLAYVALATRVGMIGMLSTHDKSLSFCPYFLDHVQLELAERIQSIHVSTQPTWRTAHLPTAIETISM